GARAGDEIPGTTDARSAERIGLEGDGTGDGRDGHALLAGEAGDLGRALALQGLAVELPLPRDDRVSAGEQLGKADEGEDGVRPGALRSAEQGQGEAGPTGGARPGEVPVHRVRVQERGGRGEDLVGRTDLFRAEALLRAVHGGGAVRAEQGVRDVVRGDELDPVHGGERRGEVCCVQGGETVEARTDLRAALVEE